MAEPSNNAVNIVVALPAEAGPLVEHFGLVSVAGCDPFRVFCADKVRLIVSGVGKAAAACAVGFLYHFNGCLRDEAWLNVGIGGHRDHPVGSAFLAHKVTEGSTDNRWYPSRVFDVPCKTVEVHSVTVPERGFSEPVLYEMEAAGFVAACARLSIAELVHVFKIVSDNACTPPHRLSTERVSQLVVAQLTAVDAIVSSLGRLADRQRTIGREPAELERFLEHWHFTVTQRHQLRDLIRRWALVFPDSTALEGVRGQSVGTYRDARAVIRYLNRTLQEAVPEMASQ